MSPFGQIALAAAMAALTACAPSQPSFNLSASEIADVTASVTANMTAAPPIFMSDLDMMRAALPAFDLQTIDAGQEREVSVMRDLAFTAENSILTRSDVARLTPLQVYLRANPLIDVRIEGYGDSAVSTERNDDLSRSRAQAVARAILSDIYITNTVVTASARTPQPAARSGHIEIFFTGR